MMNGKLRAVEYFMKKRENGIIIYCSVLKANYIMFVSGLNRYLHDFILYCNVVFSTGKRTFC